MPHFVQVSFQLQLYKLHYTYYLQYINAYNCYNHN